MRCTQRLLHILHASYCGVNTLFYIKIDGILANSIIYLFENKSAYSKIHQVNIIVRICFNVLPCNFTSANKKEKWGKKKTKLDLFIKHKT